MSCTEEERQFLRLYGEPAGKIEIIAPGVEHAFFAPGDRAGARNAMGLPIGRPVLLFVGRIQPLKGPDVAVRPVARVASSVIQMGAIEIHPWGRSRRRHRLSRPHDLRS